MIRQTEAKHTRFIICSIGFNVPHAPKACWSRLDIIKVLSYAWTGELQILGGQACANGVWAQGCQELLRWLEGIALSVEALANPGDGAET
jgi:hypothetical protein